MFADSVLRHSSELGDMFVLFAAMIAAPGTGDENEPRRMRVFRFVFLHILRKNVRRTFDARQRQNIHTDKRRRLPLITLKIIKQSQQGATRARLVIICAFVFFPTTEQPNTRRAALLSFELRRRARQCRGRR